MPGRVSGYPWFFDEAMPHELGHNFGLGLHSALVDSAGNTIGEPHRAGPAACPPGSWSLMLATAMALHLVSCGALHVAYEWVYPFTLAPGSVRAWWCCTSTAPGVEGGHGVMLHGGWVEMVFCCIALVPCIAYSNAATLP